MVVVPATAVFLREGATIVYVVEGGAVASRAVTVARRGKDRVALSTGIDAGERFALRDPAPELGR
jgi:hypothetical protein